MWSSPASQRTTDAGSGPLIRPDRRMMPRTGRAGGSKDGVRPHRSERPAGSLLHLANSKPRAMHITVTGQKLDVGDSLRSHIEDALSATVEKYFGNALDADVVLSRDGRKFRADISVHVGRDIFVRAHESVDDPYAAFDVAAAHVAKRLRRYKRRLRDHHAIEDSAETQPAQQYVLSADAEPDTPGAGASPNDNPVIIAEAVTRIERLSVSEAVMRMDLADQTAYMFRNAKNGQLNVIYRRHDGHIGWIDPQVEGGS